MGMKINSEFTVVAVLVGVALFLGPGSFLGHKLGHDFPYGYGASDAFQHQTRAEAIKDMGNFRYEAPYISSSFEGVVGRYPPVLYHLGVIFSAASGMEVYDGIYAIVLLFGVLGILVFYCLVRQFNKAVALLSLPISMLIFSFPSSIGMYWGHWPSILGQVFLICFFWAVSKGSVSGSWTLIAMAFASVMLTHTSEAIFGLVFLAMYVGWKMLSKSIAKEEMKNIISGVLIAGIVSAYYLVIFMNTWAKAQPYQFGIEPVWNGNPGFYLTSFGLVLLPLLIGAAIGILKAKEPQIAMVAGFSMLVAGFMNYAGFNVRSFQIRFFWPVYLSVFVGVGLYVVLRPAVKRAGHAALIVVLAGLVFAVSGIEEWPIVSQKESHTIPSIPSIKGYGQGMMDGGHWESLRWISQNTEKDAKIYFFYGDIYGNDALLRNTKRVHYQADPEGFVKKLQEHTISREYLSELPGDSGGRVAIRTGWFSFEDAAKEKDVPPDFFFGEKDICTFDYFVFDRTSRQQVLAEYNLLIASEIQRSNASIQVFANDVVIIMKNTKKGGECIYERTF